jgi:hypothetical protein
VPTSTPATNKTLGRMRTAVAARTEPVDRILAVVDAQGAIFRAPGFRGRAHRRGAGG